MSKLVLGTTCTVVPVREKDGSVRRVPNPATPKRPLPPEGAPVVVDAYWIRRDLDGDLEWPAEQTESAAPSDAPALPDTSPSDQPELEPEKKSNTRRARGDS